MSQKDAVSGWTVNRMAGFPAEKSNCGQLAPAAQRFSQAYMQVSSACIRRKEPVRGGRYGTNRKIVLPMRKSKSES
jgi:hypothetical protein